MDEIQKLIEEQNIVIARRDALQKEIGVIGEKINKIITNELFKISFVGTRWYLQEDQFIYSEHSQKLVLDYQDPASEPIKKLLRMYNKEYLPLEKGVTLRHFSDGQPWIKFDLNIKPKEFIKKYRLKIVDMNTENEIQRLERIRNEWLS